MLLVLKLLALGSFVGGPLVLMDWLAPEPGEPITFALLVAPCLLILFGALHLEDEPGTYRRVVVRGGNVGALLLLVQNALACWLLMSREPALPFAAMSVGGIVIGTGAAVWYTYLSVRRPPPFELARELARQARRDNLRDYMLLAISLAFVLTGLLIYPSEHDIGITTVVFFAGCGVVPIMSLRRKRRSAQAQASGTLKPLSLPADGKLEPSRRVTLTVLVCLLLGGLIVLRSSQAYPLAMRVLLMVVTAAAALGITLVLLGRLPVGYLQLEPACLTLGRRGYAMHVPWHAISSVMTGELFNNPAVLIALHDSADVSTTPATMHARALRELARNEQWHGVAVLIMTSHYAVDASALALTISHARSLHEPSDQADMLVS